MKQLGTLLPLLLIIPLVGLAQNSTDPLKEYNRSSLATLMVFHPEDEFCKDIAIVFDSIPVPDKFDDHIIPEARYIDFNAFYGLKKKNETYAFRSQDASQMELNEKLYGYLKHKHILLEGKYVGDKVRKNKDLARGLNKAKYGSSLSAEEVNLNAHAIEQLLNDNRYAQRMIAKWFNLHGHDINDAVFDMSLIQDRGYYNATDMDIAIAQRTERGLALLADAGEELIGNTYVIVNDMTYVTSEEKAQVGKLVGGVMLAVLGGLAGTDMSDAINALGDIADSFTGFNVKTHSYLYRLVWNDSIAYNFYTKHYTGKPDANKILAFLQDSISYRIEYVGHEFAFNDKAAFKSAVDRQDFIRYICTRSMDKNIAKLQKDYEDFKVKTPVSSVTDKGEILAKIGMKEDVNPNSSYQVIQRYVDEKTNRTRYRYIATVKPIRNMIWDNRYRLMEEDQEDQAVQETHFSKVSGGTILPGMLLVEGKYKNAEGSDN